MQDLPEGTKWLPGCLDRAEQEQLVAEIRKIAAEAPLFVPAMPKTGKPMSVRMTNCGALGWVTDKEGGYRYQPTHPLTGRAWPEIPQSLLALWRKFSGWPDDAQACLVNFYDAGARMGLHQDRDEVNLEAPVVSVSLGDSCLFRIGGKARRDKSVSFRLESGDVVILGGKSRMAFHGVDRIYAGSSDLLANGGRINLTMRRVH